MKWMKLCVWYLKTHFDGKIAFNNKNKWKNGCSIKLFLTYVSGNIILVGSAFFWNALCGLQKLAWPWVYFVSILSETCLQSTSLRFKRAILLNFFFSVTSSRFFFCWRCVFTAGRLSVCVCLCSVIKNWAGFWETWCDLTRPKLKLSTTFPLPFLSVTAIAKGIGLNRHQRSTSRRDVSNKHFKSAISSNFQEQLYRQENFFHHTLYFGKSCFILRACLNKTGQSLLIEDKSNNV